MIEQLLRAAPTNRFWLVLGEPGAGKTTLLENWFLRLAKGVTTPSLEAMVPVLVRLRSVPKQTWQINDETKLADALWDFAAAEKALLDAGPSELYNSQHRRSFQPVWLLDGLDEIPPDLMDERLYQNLANLPGRKLTSARMAVYESLRKTADRYKTREYEILGLRPGDQNRFLHQALGDGDGKAEELFKNIQQNVQVRLLAGNPLMLTLMADVASGDRGPKIDLPASRAEFYRRAIEEMWHRKLKADEAALGLRKDRDEYLTQAAEALGLANLRGEFSVENPHLKRGLRTSGLVRVNQVMNTFEFVHLTFQEYYLARSLAKGGLKAALEKHWSDPRYEETLALLVSILFQDKRFREIEQGLRWLVEWGEQTHRKNSKILWELGCSPLRAACHVVARSAAPLQDNDSGQLSAFLLERGVVRGGSLRRLGLSVDSFVPPALLAELAHDENRGVRVGVARNENTPPALLAKLAHDEEWLVRGVVAWNANTPPELLAELAHDKDENVRVGVVRNVNTRPELLAELAHDKDEDVRVGVAGNENTPLELLAELAHDKDEDVRWGVAGNANTPPELLAELAHDNDKIVRWSAARNPSTLLEDL